LHVSSSSAQRATTRLRGIGLSIGPAIKLVSIVGLAAMASACARQSDHASTRSMSSPRAMSQTWSPRVVQEGQPVPKGGGSYKIGSPYQVQAQWFTPREEPGYDRAGIASWYGADFHGRKTANGEVYDMNAVTAAHPTLPIPSYAYVTNLANGRTLLVRINDRGPYAHNRIIDLSRKSSQLLGFQTQGTTHVRVRYAGPAPLDGNDSRERQHLVRQPWFVNSYAFNRGQETVAYKRPALAGEASLQPSSGRAR
jgi:rare lipoprotein A